MSLVLSEEFTYLLFRCNNKHRQDWQHSSIHGHRGGDLSEGNTIEKLLHILNGIDGDSSHADISMNAWVVGIVATMRGQVKSDAKALLTSFDVVAIELVTFFNCRKSCVLRMRK